MYYNVGMDKKASSLALLNILRKHSDENHPLTQPKLLELMESEYGIELERRTIYNNCELLRQMGYEVSTYTDNGKGYYLVDRQFEPSQVFLLCNAVHSSNFIPSKYSKELIDKLLSTQSEYFRKDYKNAVYVDNASKKENNEFFYNIELLSECIKNRKIVTFDYTKYDFNKNIVNRRKEPYTIAPYYLIYMNEKTYMIAKALQHNDFIHFRVDRMKNVKETDQKYKRTGKEDDPYVYAKTKIHMYHGDDLSISIKCKNNILDDIIDIFGIDAKVYPIDGDYFEAIVKSSKEGMMYLALQYARFMEVLEPKDLREDIKKILKETIEKYK